MSVLAPTSDMTPRRGNRRLVPIATEWADERQLLILICDRTTDFVVRPHRARQKPMKRCVLAPFFSQYF